MGGASWRRIADGAASFTYPVGELPPRRNELAQSGGELGEGGEDMKEAAKGVAFTLALVMLLANFTASRPIIPTLPHRSWDWLTPWPLQVVRAGSDDLDAAELAIKVGIAIELAREFLQGLQRLVAESLYDMIRDALERGGTVTSPAGGGGGSAFTDQ